jgi:spermidine synthase
MKHRRWPRLAVVCDPTAGRVSRLLLRAALCALLFPLPAAAQEAEVIYEIRSRYQLITVLDTANGNRQLVFDGRFDGTDAIQSEMDLANPDEPVLSYARHMMAALPVAGRPSRILVVGLGGACIQRYLRRLLPDATIETAELDPEIRDVAAKYFFLKEDARQIVHLGDGRAFIERSKDTYDIIFLDAFTATSIPYHLATREFLQIVKQHLAEGGVVCANLWAGEASYWDMVKTYSTVFPELHVVDCAGSTNSLVLATPAKMGLAVRAWADKAVAFEKTHPTGLDLPQLILRGAAATTSIPDAARVLVDKGADDPGAPPGPRPARPSSIPSVPGTRHLGDRPSILPQAAAMVTAGRGAPRCPVARWCHPCSSCRWRSPR